MSAPHGFPYGSQGLFPRPPLRHSFVTALRASPLPARPAQGEAGEGRPGDFLHTCRGYFPQPGARGR